MFVTNNSTRVIKSIDSVVPMDKYHPSLNICSDIGFIPSKYIGIDEQKFNFKRANYELTRLLNNLNWS